MTAAADDAVSGQEEPPAAPAAFYGAVTVDGEPAPKGAELVATVDGEERGSIVIGQGGQYGGPGVFDEKLVVGGDTGDENASIRFLLDGRAAERTATWSVGKTERYDVRIGESGESSGALSGSPENSVDGVGHLEGQNESTSTEGEKDEEDGTEWESNGSAQARDKDVDDHERSDTGHESAMPGFGVVITVVGTLVGVCLARRSRR